MKIREHAEEHTEAVRQFNERLKAGGIALQFPLSPTPAWLPKLAGRRVFQEHYLALDDEAAVRGAYILKHQDFWIKDAVVSIGDFHSPVSEGAVNKSYAQVAVQLLRDALGRQPLLYGLGMGSYRQPIARLLSAAGWRMFSVPFFCRIVHPTRFLRRAAYLRRKAPMRWAMDALAVSGLGWLGVHALQAVCGRGLRLDPAVAAEPVAEFADWADDLWRRYRGQYGMTAVRDAEALRILYPPENPRFIRLKVSEHSRPIGWAVLLNTRLTRHKQFGDLRLGSIVDCFGDTGRAAQVVRAARACLASQGVDLIVSNQSHAAWGGGFRRAGFLRGPSNFLFAASRKLTELLQRDGVNNDDLHFNRGDGDGPINL